MKYAAGFIFLALFVFSCKSVTNSQQNQDDISEVKGIVDKVELTKKDQNREPTNCTAHLLSNFETEKIKLLLEQAGYTVKHEYSVPEKSDLLVWSMYKSLSQREDYLEGLVLEKGQLARCKQHMEQRASSSREWSWAQRISANVDSFLEIIGVKGATTTSQSLSCFQLTPPFSVNKTGFHCKYETMISYYSDEYELIPVAINQSNYDYHLSGCAPTAVGRFVDIKSFLVKNLPQCSKNQ